MLHPALGRSLVYETEICGFTNATPSAAESFDAIVAGDFIEHLPPDQVYPTLCEFFRLLRLKGLLLLTTPDPRYVKNKLGERASARPGGGTGNWHEAPA